MKIILIAISLLLVCGIANAGLLDMAKPAGFGLYEVTKSEGETVDGVQIMTGLMVEVVSDIKDVGSVDCGVAGDSRGAAGIAGASVSIKKIAEKYNWQYQPDEEVNVGICGGYRPDDSCWLAGFYGRISF